VVDAIDDTIDEEEQVIVDDDIIEIEATIEGDLIQTIESHENEVLEKQDELIEIIGKNMKTIDHEKIELHIKIDEITKNQTIPDQIDLEKDLTIKQDAIKIRRKNFQKKFNVVVIQFVIVLNKVLVE
jgi:hypothetical protein